MAEDTAARTFAAGVHFIMGSFRESPNHLLASLPSADFSLIASYIRTVPLFLGDVLVAAGEELPFVYFPNGGIISTTVPLRDGEMIEVGLVGCDGVYGATTALDLNISPTFASVQFSGTAAVISSKQFQHVFAKSAALRAVVMRQQRIDIARAEQLAACNASHAVKARVCRRLLRMRDLAKCDILPVTQEALARMLGVRRNSISLAAGAMQDAGIIQYTRGQIRIVDASALIQNSCECYETNKTHAGSFGDLTSRQDVMTSFGLQRPAE